MQLFKNQLFKNPPKIIFFDIDGTLYIKEKDAVPESVKDAFYHLQKNNIKIAIATGRGISIFPNSINELIKEFHIDLLITINGQYIEYQHKKFMDFPIASRYLKQITKSLQNHQIAYAYMTKHEILCVGKTKQMTDALNSLNINYRQISAFDFNQPVYQMLGFYQDGEITLELPETLKTVRWHDSGADILVKEASKARGIKQVLDKLNIKTSETMAFGDGLNDVEMLQYAGFGVAMGNGHDALKQVANFVCPRHDEDGIYQGLLTFGLIS